MPRTPLATELVIPIGAPIPWESQVIPWWALLCNGNTIGNAGSGGTARANADTYALFKFRWDNVANTEAPIQDSTGTPTSRGSDALSDFNGLKRMPLPDLRTSGIYGYHSGNVKFNTMGKKGGVDARDMSHTHGMKSHSHGFSHTHTGWVSQSSYLGGAGVWYNDPSNGHRHSFTTDGPNTSTTSGPSDNTSDSAGSATQDFMPPYQVYNFIVRYF